MQIIEITEPSLVKSDEPNIAVGIDFGTTNSLIALSNFRHVTVISDEGGNFLIPSVIPFLEEKYLNDCKSRDSFRSIKRLFGKTIPDIIENPTLFTLIKNHINIDSKTLKIKHGSQLLRIHEIASQIFKYLKQQAERELRRVVTKAVVTVPAHFNDAARGEVMMAAKIAGFEILRLISEPTAAAIAYGLNKLSTGCYLVYDLGGGTFDVSILNMQQGILQVIATAGDNMLGGDDIDYLVMNYLSTAYSIEKSEELREIAKIAKETLSYKDFFITEYADIVIELTKIDFEQIILNLIEKTIDIAKEAMDSADDPNLSGIILVGGSSRIPLIANLLSQNFNKKIYSDIDPDLAVVYGAAIQAENLTSDTSNSLLMDVVPLSLGIELNGGITEKIILRNSLIPISVTKEFTNYADYQTSIKIHVVQGEREMVSDCISLGQFEVKIPPMKAGSVRLDITFSIDADGILSVSAFEKNIASSYYIELKPHDSLTNMQVENILEDSYQNIVQDHNNKLLQEAIIHTKSLIHNVEGAIKEMFSKLESIEVENIKKDIIYLNKILCSEDRDAILEAAVKFEDRTKTIIATRLNIAISDLLNGKHI